MLLILRHIVSWYDIPDLVTLLATFSFFCLALFFSTRTPSVPSDSEFALNIELVKQELLGIAVTSMMFAGGLSFFRAFEERYPDLKLSEEDGLIVFFAVCFFIFYYSVPIRRKYMSYAGG